MKIDSVHAIPGVSGFFFDDQRAIKEGAEKDGITYHGDPVTSGFEHIREAGESLIVEVRLTDGTSVTGDCCAVQYSGVGGRDPLFRASKYQSTIEGSVANALVGRDAAAFADNVAVLERCESDIGGGDQLHTAIRYGVSQALLAAAARASRTARYEVLATTLGTTPATSPVPVFGQSGDARRVNAEKMLIKRVPVLPHGLFNSLNKVGEHGEQLVEYLDWLSGRASELGAADYSPQFHIDVYGTLGELFDGSYDSPAVADYFQELEEAASPYSLQIEGPIEAESRSSQIHAMAELRDGLDDAGVTVDVVADEWCNTLDDVRAFVDSEAADVVQVKTPDLGSIHRSAQAVQYCEGTSTRAYLGGTCNETATSARSCAHVALATDAAQTLAKPGMGFDEGFMIVTNEMRRALHRSEDVPHTEQQA